MKDSQSWVSAHVLIHGLVQGVAFRAFTLGAASRLGLQGGVRNLTNGQVEVMLEGARETIEQVLEVLRVGPPHGRVDGLHVEWGAYSGEYSNFQIWY